jgi:glycopeptide antibiotics resistance protein
VSFGGFGTYKRKSCTKNVGEIDTWRKKLKWETKKHKLEYNLPLLPFGFFFWLKTKKIVFALFLTLSFSLSLSLSLSLFLSLFDLESKIRI